MKRLLQITFVLTLLLITILNLWARESGLAGGYTNAPGDSNCGTTGACHNIGLNTGSNLSNLIFETNFIGNGYIPDSTYNMTVAFKEPTRTKYGFQITCLEEKTNDPCGTFTTVDTRVTSMSLLVNSKTRSYLGHTSTGTSTTSKDSTF